MENSGLIEQGVELMLYGMGFVFVFLALLVVSTNTMSRLVNRYYPEAEPVAAPRRKAAAPAAAQDDAQLLAVISAAIHQYRKNHRK